MVSWMGQTAVDSVLDDSWGHRWRRGNEASFYSRRRLIIKEIQRLAQQEGAVSLTAAAEELETRRRQEGLSLTGLNELLRRPQQQREAVTCSRARKGQRRR